MPEKERGLMPINLSSQCSPVLFLRPEGDLTNPQIAWIGGWERGTRGLGEGRGLEGQTVVGDSNQGIQFPVLSGIVGGPCKMMLDFILPFSSISYLPPCSIVGNSQS